MSRDRNEADTRAELIDPKLKKNGWGVLTESKIRRELICPGRILTGGKRGDQLKCDYVLIYKGRKLAAVEAKKEGLSYVEGVRQAIDYAERLACRIAYTTNGHEIYQIDMSNGQQSLVDNYMTPEDLWDFTFEKSPKETESSYTNIWRERFASIPFDTKSGSWIPRYYQENAINAALEQIAKGENRVLLTLATGTGKTAISFQIAWKLFNSRWSLASRENPDEGIRRPRILFLADRNILANQAFNDFGAFGENALARITPGDIKRSGRVPRNASVFFTIFQTFMSGSDEEGNRTPYFGDYPSDFFDLVIIDECHRGGANDESSWRDILNHFSPAVQLGLTATPKRNNNADTYKYFEKPAYIYSLADGINDGFLTPFKVHSVEGTIDEYTFRPGDGQIIEGNPKPGKVYKEGDFNRIIVIPAREERRVHYWMDKISPDEKTIVFCNTQAHAGLVRDFVNAYATSKGWTDKTDYCVRVTSSDGEAGEADLRIFQDNEKKIPTILTTSKKLTTGVDARNVRNIILMRPCNNMIEFKQIIGRGTRVYDGKDFFTVFDFVKAHINFSDPEWDGEPLDPPDPVPPRKPIVEPIVKPENGEEPVTENIVIKLRDGRSREIKHSSSVMYWSSEGKPITAKEFLEEMFDDLPKFFESEDKLREVWSDPKTRDKLLKELSGEGYNFDKLESMKELINANHSDVFDVLAYVAFKTKVVSREERVSTASFKLRKIFEDKNQREFIDFVLSRYIEDGVRELSIDNINQLVELKYGTVSDAISKLGSISVVKDTFISFQRCLYVD